MNMEIQAKNISEISKILHSINGVIFINKGTEPRLYCIEDLQYTDELSIGQIFNGLLAYYGKSAEQYGTSFPKYRTASGDISVRFTALKEKIDSCKNDYEKVILASKELGEEAPHIIPLADVQSNLNSYLKEL